MSTNPSLLKIVRQVHLYFGVFITPALIFFAFTGFVQTFSLHETTRGSSYKPPRILEQLGQLHKKQTLVLREGRPQGPPTAPDKPKAAAAGSVSTAKPADSPGAKPKNLLAMKLFFAVVSVGLFTSTITGLYMSYTFTRSKPLITGALIAGIVVPVLLTLF